MEIYVSEKEKLVTYPLGATVKSLEQHDRELLEKFYETVYGIADDGCSEEYSVITLYGLEKVLIDFLEERGVDDE